MAVVAVGSGQYIYPNYPYAAAYEPQRDYAFSYKVADPITGDAKDQTEIKQAGVVQGGYSVVQPDGSLRQVSYTAADGAGFNAVVKTIPGVAPPNGPIRSAYSPYAAAPYAYPYAAYPYAAAASPYAYSPYYRALRY